MDKNTKQIRITVSKNVHQELVSIQEHLKSDGVNISLANIVAKFLELSKGKIKTGYEK
ncbi:MAG: hypothetical protein NW226_14010 [Microscillaceae bacterium]|nr:hypothetical protein [Microscillaceae bacterium]